VRVSGNSKSRVTPLERRDVGAIADGTAHRHGSQSGRSFQLVPREGIPGRTKLSPHSLELVSAASGAVQLEFSKLDR